MFSILKKKNDQIKPRGRHQILNEIKIFLDLKVSSSEIEVATEQDFAEKAFVAEKIEEIERYVNSGLFLHELDNKKVNDDLAGILKYDFAPCVLFAQDDLLERYNILKKNTIKNIILLLKSRGVDSRVLEKSKEELIPTINTLCFFAYMTLGGLLPDPDNEQLEKVWWIMHDTKFTPGLIRGALGGFEGQDLKREIQDIRVLARKLNSSGKINDKDLKVIEKEIEESTKSRVDD